MPAPKDAFDFIEDEPTPEPKRTSGSLLLRLGRSLARLVGLWRRPDAGTRLVHDVDRLVGQEAPGDVSRGEIDRLDILGQCPDGNIVHACGRNRFHPFQVYVTRGFQRDFALGQIIERDEP